MSILPANKQAQYDQLHAEVVGQLREAVEALRPLVADDETTVTIMTVVETGLLFMRANPIQLSTLSTMYALALIELAKKPAISVAV